MDDPKPPYVRFEARAVEDRQASIDAGHYVAKDVIFAIVTPSGTREVLEKVASEWIDGLKESVTNERIPADWLSYYQRRLADWKESRESPEEGTPITNWSALSPAQTKTLLDLHIRTVEDVAAMTEEAIDSLGMGARAIRSKAQAWLDSSKDTGKVAAELEALRQENSQLKSRDKEREEQFLNLETRLKALEVTPKLEETT